MSQSIRIDEEVYDRLQSLKHEMERERRGHVSFSDVIAVLVVRHDGKEKAR